MGIGRREFLRLTTLAASGLAINPLKAVVTTNEVYINKKLGILFYIPEEWGFVNVKDFGKLKDGQILGDGWNDSKDKVWEDLGEPICIVTKYYEDLPKYKGVFSPTITLNITPKKELEDLGHMSFEELIGMSYYGTSQLLKDFTIVKTYDPYYICDCKFYEYDAEYIFEHFEMEKPIKVELKTLKAEHNEFYYDFNFHQSAEQNQTAHNEFSKFITTIKLI